MMMMQQSLFLLAIAAATCGAVIDASADDPIEIDPIILAAEENRIAAIARAMPSAVSVFVPGGAGGGSGVLISPAGYALTNFHVTSPAGSYMRCGLSDGNIYDAVIVGIDPVGDLAMIRLIGRDDFPFAELADSRRATPGDWCMVIGNPFLLASNLQPTVTWGILSGVGRYQYPSGTLLEYADCLQTDASINPGNSGGPIYDAEGRLLGIVGRASFEKRGRVNVGVGYAISINQAKNFLGYLRSGRIVDHATLGATYATDPGGGVRITNILETSDAYRRGLRYADEVLELDGRVVQTANDLQNVLGTLPSGWRVKMSFRHEGETKDTLVRLSGVHGRDELLEKMAGVLPPPPPRPQTPDREEGQPEGDAPKDSDGENKEIELPDGKKPIRRPKAMPRAVKPPAKIPQAVADLLEQRKGYANYYFNLQQQQAFIDSLRTQFPATASNEAATPGKPAARGEDLAWVIEGETTEEPPRSVLIRIGSGKNVMVVGDLPIEAESKADMYDGVDAQSIAAILPALDAWRRMIKSGPKKFGECFYLGEVPMAGERPLRHCMVGIDGEMEVRWLTHPSSRMVQAIEVFADRDRDPAELWLVRDSDDPNARPSQLDLRFGVDSVLQISVKSWKRVPESELDQLNAEATQ
jgi:serine protease Do